MSNDSSHLRPAGRWQPLSPEEMQAWLPQYRFEVLLGCGGMGAVYQAEQITPERPVAVRVLLADRPGEANELDSFKQQVLALSELEQPSPVPEDTLPPWVGSTPVVGTSPLRLIEPGVGPALVASPVASREPPS